MEQIPQFIAAVLVLMIIPGPDMMYCIASGISHGTKGAMLSATGIGVGGLFLTAGVACIVFLSSNFNSNIFVFLQTVGGLYLLYLGVKILIDKPDVSEGTRKKDAHYGIFLRGIITNIANPKALVFFISFIPQFIPTNASAPHIKALILGVILCTIGTTINFLFGLSGISLQFLASKKIYGRRISDYITASVFIFIAFYFLWNYIIFIFTH